MPSPLQKLAIGVDPIGTLRNTRKQFEDPLTFVDELFQNVQRARGARAEWRVTDAEIRVIDDGAGCDSFESVFTQSVSGWDQDTREGEDAFGIGFFASILVAEEIEVISRGRRAVFDVARMFAESRLDVVTVREDKRCRPKGFEVRLRKLLPSVTGDLDKLRRRITDVARFVPLKTVLDGRVLPRYAVTDLLPEEQGARFVSTVEDPLFTGVLVAAGNTWSAPAGYYQSRAVAGLWEAKGCRGRIFVKPGVVGLRCPDRKAFLQDDRLKTLTEAVKGKIRDMARRIVAEGTPKDLEQFEELVVDNLTATDFYDLVRFDGVGVDTDWLDTFTQEAANIEELKRREYVYDDQRAWQRVAEKASEQVLEQRRAAEVEQQVVRTTVECRVEASPAVAVLVAEPSGYLAGVRPTREQVLESAEEAAAAEVEAPLDEGTQIIEVLDEPRAVRPAEPAVLTVPVPVEEGAPEDEPAAPEPAPIEPPAPQGVRAHELARYPLLVWVKLDEVSAHKALLAELAKAGVPIVAVKNRLQSVLLGTMPNAVHVSKAVSRWTQEMEAREPGPRTDAERRALKLLDWVEHVVCPDWRGRFHVGDLRLTVTLEVNGAAVPETRAEQPVRALAYRGEIWMNRAVIDWSYLDGCADVEAVDLSAHDRAWLAKHVEEITHELVHALRGTEKHDEAHYEAQMELQRALLAYVFPGPARRVTA